MDESPKEMPMQKEDPATDKKKVPLIPLLILVVLIVCSGGAFYYFQSKDSTTMDTDLSVSITDFDLSQDTVYSINDTYYEQAMESDVWLYGYYTENYYGSALTDGEEGSYNETNLDITAITDTDFTVGDLILVKGKYEDGSSYTFVVSEVYVLTAEDLTVINSYKYPYAEMTITDYTNHLTHGCASAEFTVEVKNIGNIPLVESDFYTDGTELSKFKVIEDKDGVESSGYAIAEEGEVRTWGFTNFGTIQPGETKTLTYAGSGLVQSGCTGGDVFCGTGGTPNTFCPSSTIPGGEKQFQLKLGYLKPGSYTENIITSSSNVVTVTVDTCVCDLSK